MHKASEEVRAKNRLAVARYRAKNLERQRERGRQWHLDNPEKAKCRNAKWRAEHPGYGTQWSRDNPGKGTAYTQKWQRKNPEKVAATDSRSRSKNKDKIRERHKNWRESNRDWLRAYRARRDAMKIAATPVWADHEIIALIYAEARHRGLEVDHIVPLKGKHVRGLHVHYNMQLLSKNANTRKNNRIAFLVPVGQGE